MFRKFRLLIIFIYYCINRLRSFSRHLAFACMIHKLGMCHLRAAFIKNCKSLTCIGIHLAKLSCKLGNLDRYHPRLAFIFRCMHRVHTFYRHFKILKMIYISHKYHQITTFQNHYIFMIDIIFLLDLTWYTQDNQYKSHLWQFFTFLNIYLKHTLSHYQMLLYNRDIINSYLLHLPFLFDHIMLEYITYHLLLLSKMKDNFGSFHPSSLFSCFSM